MRHSRLSFLAVALASLLGAVDAEFTFAGRVVNSVTGAPVKRALVVISGFRPIAKPGTRPMVVDRDALTGADGAFFFAALPEATYRVSARKPQFDTSVLPTVKLGPSQEAVEIRMQPLGVVEGAVSDSDGNPLPGVRIKALIVETDQGRKQVKESRSVATNDRGAFRLWNLRPGEYYLKVAGRGGETRAFLGDRGPIVDTREAYEDVYFGGARTLASATSIELQPGQNARADFTIAPQPAFAIRGRLKDFVPGERAELELFRQGNPDQISVRAAFNSSTGRFEINDVIDGSYTVRVVQGEEEKALYAETDVRVAGSDVDGLTLTLAPGISIRGQTHCSRSATSRTDEILACAVEVFLIGSDNDVVDFVEAFPKDPEEASRGDSEWSIGPVRPGHYTLQVKAHAGHVSAISLGGAGLSPGAKIDLQPGAQSVRLEVWVSNEGGDLEVGTAPSLGSSASIFVLPNSPSFEPPHGGPDFRDGTLKGLAPGDYNVYAVPSGDKLEYANPETFRTTHPAAKVTVQAGSTQKVVIEAIPE